MSKQFDKQFKENAVQYYLSHKELGLKKCAENLGISRNALRNWGGGAPMKIPERYPHGEQEIMQATRQKRSQC